MLRQQEAEIEELERAAKEVERARRRQEAMDRGEDPDEIVFTSEDEEEGEDGEGGGGAGEGGQTDKGMEQVRKKRSAGTPLHMVLYCAGQNEPFKHGLGLSL